MLSEEPSLLLSKVYNLLDYHDDRTRILQWIVWFMPWFLLFVTFYTYLLHLPISRAMFFPEKLEIEESILHHIRSSNLRSVRSRRLFPSLSYLRVQCNMIRVPRKSRHRIA